jgi:hypothetical protein
MSAAAHLPYPGLRPFEEADHDLFFGREEQVGGLLGLLEDASLVAVVGASGSGKSSLVKAGLLPVIRQGFLLGTGDWIVAVARPGEEPYGCLAHQLAAVLPAAEPELLQALRRSDRGLLGACELAKVGVETRVLVVVDQFEELFGFRRAASPISRDQAAAFVAMLLRTAVEPEGRIRIVLTMRSDFIGDCEAFLGLPEAISRSQFLVPRLTRSQMEEAIVRPGQVGGAEYERFAFEEGLVNRIVNDAGDRPDQLPLMQHALMRTWKLAKARGSASLLAHRDYDQAGAIEKALSQDADAAFQELEKPRQEIARRMFLLLCDVSLDGQITRRRPPVAEVMDVAGASRGEVEQVVRAFQREDRNFLLPPAAFAFEETSLLDVSHEALLRRWELFQKWREGETRDAAELRRLAEQADLRASGEGGLLRATDLGRIRAWQQRTSPAWSRRYVSQKVWSSAAEFIKASRQRLRAVGCLGGLLVLLFLAATAFSIYSAIRARDAQAKVESTLVDKFWRTLGVDDDSISNYEERDSLWDLAELEIPAVRKRLIERWFQSEASFVRGNRREGLAFRAAGELDPEIRTAVRLAARGLMPVLLARLQKDPKDFSASVKNTADLFQRLDSAAARDFWKELLYTASLDPEKDAQRLPDLAILLDATLPRTNGADAELFAARLAASLETTSDYAFLVGSAVLAPLADHLEPPQVERLAQRLFALTERPSRLWSGGSPEVLERLTQRLDPAAAEVFAKRVTARLEVIPQEGDPEDSWRILAALAGRFEAPAAAGLAVRFAVLAEKGSIGTFQSLAMERTASRLEPAAVPQAARRLLSLLETRTGIYDRLALSAPLAALVGRLDPAEAERLATAAVGSIVGAMERDYEQNRPSYRHEMEVLARHLAQSEAEALAQRLAESQSLAGRRNIRPVALLAALASRLPSRVAEKYADLLATVLLGDRDSGNWAEVAEALGTAVENLEPAAASRVFDRLALAAEQDQPRFCSMGAALAGLAARLETPQRKSKIARLAEAEAQTLDAGSSVAENFDCGRSLVNLIGPLEAEGSRSRLFALSYWLVAVNFIPHPEETPGQNPARRQMEAALASLNEHELVEVLKWPYSVGEVEPMILAELERKLSAKLKKPVAFGGDLDSFLDQAESLGIENHKTPARRPRLGDVQKELAALISR